MKTKAFISLTICLVMAFAFTGCGEKTAENAAALTLWGSSDDQTMLGEMRDGFLSANTDISNEITVKVTGEDKAMEEALKDVDAAADVYAIGHDQLGSLVDAGAVYEITGDNLTAIKNSCSQAALSAATYNGKVYGFPSTAETYLLFYNKSMLSEEETGSLNTIMNKKLSAGVSPFGMNLSEGYYGSSFFFTAGCTLFGDNGENADECTFNDANGMKAANFIATLKGRGVLNCDENEALTQIKAGKLASYVTGPWKATAMKEALGDNYGVTKLPTVAMTDADAQTQMKSFAGYKIYVVNSKTDDPAASMKLAAYLTNEDSQLKRYNDRALLPVNTSVAANSTVTSDTTVKATLNQLESAVPMPGISQISKYWTAFKAFTLDCYNGKITSGNMQQKLDNMVTQITAK